MKKDEKIPWEDDRLPLKSKKFIAFMVSEATWKTIVLATLFLTRDVLIARTDADGTGFGLWWFLFTVVIIAGFIEAGFIGGQAWLDRYVRVAQITANGGKPSKGTVAPTEEDLPEEPTTPNPS